MTLTPPSPSLEGEGRVGGNMIYRVCINVQIIQVSMVNND